MTNAIMKTKVHLILTKSCSLVMYKCPFECLYAVLCIMNKSLIGFCTMLKYAVKSVLFLGFKASSTKEVSWLVWQARTWWCKRALVLIPVQKWILSKISILVYTWYRICSLKSWKDKINIFVMYWRLRLPQFSVERSMLGE